MRTSQATTRGEPIGLNWALPGSKVAHDSLTQQPTPPRIKLLHVITKFSTGSGGNTLLSATGMDAARYDVWVAGSSQGSPWEHPLWERAELAGVKTVRLPRLEERVSLLHDLVVFLQLVRLIRRERFSIVHTHSAKGGFLGRLAAAFCRTPVVIHTFHSFPFHDFMSRRKRILYMLLERLAARFTDEFLAVAPLVAREAVERRIVPPGRIAVVPSAVEVDAIPAGPDPALRQELGIRESVPLIGSVGRLDYQKAPLDFVRMAAAVAAKRPDARFVLVGDGPLLEKVRDEARRLQVPLILPGFRDDATRFAASVDVFVMSSLYEGLGRAVTEALAAGRPVVATAVNGVPDLVIPGATGLLAPPARPDVLADCVLWLLDHSDEARRMSHNGRSAVRKVFDPAVMCHLLHETYSRLLGLPTPATTDASSAPDNGTADGVVLRSRDGWPADVAVRGDGG